MPGDARVCARLPDGLGRWVGVAAMFRGVVTMSRCSGAISDGGIADGIVGVFGVIEVCLLPPALEEDASSVSGLCAKYLGMEAECAGEGVHEVDVALLVRCGRETDTPCCSTAPASKSAPCTSAINAELVARGYEVRVWMCADVSIDVCSFCACLVMVDSGRTVGCTKC